MLPAHRLMLLLGYSDKNLQIFSFEHLGVNFTEMKPH